MRIDKRLNLVIPVTDSTGKPTAFIHATPISSDVFDTYFLPIAKTFSAIYSEGLGAIAGPRVADKMLRRVSQDLGVWDTPAGVKAGLVAEIRRLTNVMCVGKNGWEMLPLNDAVSSGAIDQQDMSEVEAALVFFTVASAMHRRTDLGAILDGGMSLWGARTELLSCTEFLSSLPTSTPDASSGAAVTT